MASFFNYLSSFFFKFEPFSLISIFLINLILLLFLKMPLGLGVLILYKN
jgi:hypothetical protein